MAMWRRQPDPLDDRVEVLDLRHFSSAELRPLLDEETRVWSHLLFWDYRSSGDMILRYVDAKILPGYASVQRSQVVGYAFFVYEGSKGVIGDMFVSHGIPTVNGERLGIEEHLVQNSISTLQQSPGIHRVEAQLLAHESGMLVRPFVTQGFRRYQRLFMLQPLPPPEQRPNVQLPSDIEMRRWAEHDYQNVAALITAAYRNHVDSDINDQYRSVSGALRFLNNIVRFPGCGVFDPASSFVAIRKDTKSVVGVILCSRVRSDVGHVTQVCLLPDQRGRGIGEALLNAAAAELQRRNFSALTLTVTEANEGAVRLYKRLGYKVERIFDAFVWEG